MGKLWDQIRRAVSDEFFVVGDHADERMRERRIELWQVVGEIDDARLIVEREGDLPYPTAVVEQSLADGTRIRVVWAWLQRRQLAKLVTVHLIQRRL